MPLNPRNLQTPDPMDEMDVKGRKTPQPPYVDVDAVDLILPFSPLTNFIFFPSGVRANRIALILSVVVCCIVLIAIVCAYLFRQRCQNPKVSQ